MIEINSENFEQETSTGIVVVDFWASWCGPCVALAPVLNELSEKNKDVKVVKLNIDENPNISDKFNISSIPSVLFFKQGKIEDRTVGFKSLKTFQEILDKLK